MPAVIPINESIAIPNHETADTARQEIKAAETFVKKAMSEINAAEKWIAIGVRLNELKGTLARTNQWDKTAPGWRQAFADNRFGMTFATGSKFAMIGQVLGNAVSSRETALLPTSWNVLYLLASGFKNNPEQLKLAIREGKVTALMSVKEANALAGNKPKKQSKEKKETKEPKVTPMKTLESWRKEYVTAAKILTISERRKELIAFAHSMGFDIEIKSEPITVNLAVPGFKKGG